MSRDADINDAVAAAPSTWTEEHAAPEAPPVRVAQPLFGFRVAADDDSEAADEADAARALALEAIARVPLTAREWEMIARIAVLAGLPGFNLGWVRDYLAAGTVR